LQVVQHLDLQSIQTFATLDLDGTISNSTGSSELTITGTSDLGGNITTSGTQDYEDSVVLSSNVTLTTTNSNVTFDSTIKGSTNNENLIISAGTGNINFNDTVGSNANNYNLDNNATVTQLTGGDDGEGGDFLGTFTHAANFGGSTKTVGNVTFTRHTAANSDATNVTIYSVNEIGEGGSWGTASYGSSDNDNNLEDVMESIRWTASTNENGDYDGKVGVELTGLNSGYIYKLQLLVRENCCLNRGYDVTFKNGSSDVVTIKEDFSTVNNTSPSPVDYSQVISHSFESSGTSVIITLDGLVTSFGDKNPILNALTLEQIDTSNNTDGIGTLTVTGGQINAGSIFTNGTLLVTNSDNSSITGAISDGVNSAAILTKAGAGTLTLSGTNTYSGDTTINAGTIKLTGSLNTATDLIIASGATLDLQSTQTFATLDLDGTISRSAGSSALTITGASDLGGSITTSGSQTYTGAITLTANTTLTSTGDAISASTIDGGYSLTINSGAAQSLTSAIGSSTALTSINVSTTSGNLTLGDDIAVTSTGTDAMIFNAGSSTAAGTSTGGNIIISGSPTFTTGSGGRMTYYTGSISGSTGLTSLIGSGSHRFRYNSDETTTNYSAALSSGKYAIYREQPTLTITADNETVTYSTAPSESVTITGMQNGDASATVVTTDASISIGGDTSTSGNYIVGDHTITPSAAASTYGYGFSYSTGTLTVNTKALTIGGITASNKTYNGNTTATIDASAATFTGLVDGDAVTVSATGTFDNKNVGTNKTVTLS
jgi:autotransporter-associated beta strand protein